MWSTKSKLHEHGRAKRVEILKESSPVSYADVLKWWRDDAEFRLFFTQLLADAPYAAFRWETPPITCATAERPFEFVLLDSPGLARTPDREAFAEYFARPNLMKLSLPLLISATTRRWLCPVQSDRSRRMDTWPLSFAKRRSRNAPPYGAWSASRWSSVLARRQFGSAPPEPACRELHVRIDNRPKYYGFLPYRTVPFG